MGRKILIPIVIVIGLLVLFFGFPKEVFLQKTVLIMASSQTVQQTWTLPDKITEARKLVENMQLNLGTKNVSYTEKRVSVDSKGRINATTINLKDAERQIGLVLLNKTSGQLTPIVITKKGGQLISPTGYNIDIVTRSSGIRWNMWATQYKVIAPENMMVILNKWPEVDKKATTKTVFLKNGKKQTITTPQTVKFYVYSAYNDDLRTPEMVATGDKYIKDMVSQAFQILLEKNVKSLAYPDKLVADVPVFSLDFFARLPLLEQTDFGEFMLDPQASSDRVRVVIEANGPDAYVHTCSKAAACGWVQFTSGTYKMIVKTYSDAKLISDFKTGAGDQLNSMMAAILLYDYNLKGLMARHGANITNDPRLEEYLAASYNGSPLVATKSLNASIAKGLTDWLDKLKNQTKQYIAKIRVLQSFN